jgi:hypothetical protein
MVTFPDNKKIVRQKGHFFQRWGRLFLDTGMSRGISDHGAYSAGGALKITRSGGEEQAVVICPDNNATTTVLWKNKDNKDSIGTCSASLKQNR